MSQPVTSWLDKPWIYSMPKGEDSLVAWREKWIAYILDYCEHKNLHVVNIFDLKREEPFSKLDQKSFSDLVNCLLIAEHAKWHDKQKNLLVIYWRSLDKWADLIIQTAKEKQINIIDGLAGLSELVPSVVCLTKDEQGQLLRLITNKCGRLIDRKKLIIRVN